MSAGDGRSADLLEDLVTALKANTDLINRLAGGADDVRVRHTSEAQDAPAELRVHVAYSDGTHRGSGTRFGFIVQVAVVVTADWKEANGTLEMHRILDDAMATVDKGADSPGLVPIGPAGGSPSALEDGERFVLAARFRYQRTIQDHSK